MKTQWFKNAIVAAIAALALAPSVTLALDPDIYIGPTANETSISNPDGSWIHWYVNSGITAADITFDTNNPPVLGNTNGSIHMTATWLGSGNPDMYDVAVAGGDFWGSSFFNAGLYKALELDWRYDTNTSTVTSNNAYVTLSIDVHNVPGVPLATFSAASGDTNYGSVLFDGAWHHVSIPIPIDIAGASAAWGIGFKDFKANPVAGVQAFNVANLTLLARNAPPPPPTITIEKTRPGLRQFADATPNYNRQNLRTDTQAATSIAKNLDWLGHPGATYSWTISEMPGPGHNGFNAALTITPDPAESMTFADPDWGATNALWVHINENADGTVSAGVYYKTNQPSANGMFVTGTTNNPGVNGRLSNGDTLNAPTGIGTWSLTFVNDTDITLTAPNGSSTNVVLPAEVAATYTNVSFAFYSGMNTDANKGQFLTLSSFSVTGVVNSFTENLTDGALNTPFLVLQSQGYAGNPNPPNQFLLTTADAYWLHWTLPDSEFSLQTQTNLGISPGNWNDFAPMATNLLNGSTRWAKVTQAGLPSTSQSFFALLKRPFTGLQVLLPGETNAPNTISGKTGSPTSINAGDVVSVTINAVDSTFHIVNVSGDNIHTTTTDGTAVTDLDAALNAGTLQRQIQFNSSGSWTVTSTNTSKVMPAATSSPITVN